MDEAAKRRVRVFIERQFGVRYSDVHVWRLLGQMGFSSQKPERRALERDEMAIEDWKKRVWPELNPVEYLWAWLERHALANHCPDSLAELHHGARSKLKSAQRRSSIIAACWTQAELF